MKYRIIVFICLICLIGIGVVSPPKPVAAAGNTYYVATTGSDSNPGTLSEPWLTIQHAADTAVAGDTVNIQGGAYSSTQIEFDNSGSAGNYITFQNYNSGAVNVNITDSQSAAVLIYHASYLQLIGFKVSAPTCQNDIDIYGSSYVTVQNCYCTNCEWSGIAAENGSTYVTVNGCEITGTNTSAMEEMISFYGVDHFEIENCLVHDPGGDQRIGICLKDDDGEVGSSNGSVHNNIVYNIPGYAVANGIYPGGHCSNINVYDTT